MAFQTSLKRSLPALSPFRGVASSTVPSSRALVAKSSGQVRSLQLSCEPTSAEAPILPQENSVQSRACGPVQESRFLQQLLPRTPLFLEQQPTSSENDGPQFRFPLGTFFNAPTRETGLALKRAFAYAIKEHGIVGIQLGFDDPKSSFLLDIVEAMGCTPDTHSNREGALWDVTYKPSGVFSDKTNTNVVSRSQGLGEFEWHTDGAFEENPQRYFGLHVVHPDKKGGGIFRVIPLDKLIRHLSPGTIQTLLTHEFDVQVPPEFYKGKATNRMTLLTVGPETGRYLLRYRKDILPNPPSKDPKACSAVAELHEMLEGETEGAIAEIFAEDIFRENVVLLMDNARFLHSRTEIKDPKRLLRRVRFNGTPEV